VVLGVGVNRAWTLSTRGRPGTSLHRLLAPAPPPTAEQLLVALPPRAAARVRRLESGGVAALLDDWRARAVGLGGPVVRRDPRGQGRSGGAVDVDLDGALLVETDSGTVRLLAGDVALCLGR